MKSFGYIVETFPSAVDFLASPHLDDTGCLIADIHMPAMTGVELYERLIKTEHTIPTILMTAYPDNAVRARVLNNGVVAYLCKPFDDEELIRCVRVALGRGKLSAENS